MHTMLSILAQLPRTVVAVLQPQDFTRYQLVRDRGLLCDLLLTNSCPCLFRGDTRRNTRRLRALLARYRNINTQLARHFSAGDFAVEVVLLCISTISTCLQVLPALDSLPPLVTSGYGRSEVNKAALSHDCFHYNGRTQGMVGSKAGKFLSAKQTCKS